MRKMRNESGFTLLEIALVILIAGLLIGAVLNSRAIQDAAKSMRLQKQVEELIVAVELYVDKMGHFPDAVGGANTLGAAYASNLIQQNLIRSGRAANVHPWAGQIYFRHSEILAENPFSIAGVPLFSYRGIENDWAEALDLALDDGVGTTGFIQATNTSENDTSIGYGTNDVVNIFVRY